MIVEDTTEDMVDVKISIMKICPYTLQEKILQEKKIIDSMMDTVDAHNVVRNILFDIINTITTLS